MSINRGMDKEDVVPIYNGILLSHEKEWNNATYSNMDGLSVCYTGWNKSDGGEITYGIPYMDNLKINDTKEIIYQKETDLENKTYGCQGKRMGARDI